MFSVWYNATIMGAIGGLFGSFPVDFAGEIFNSSLFHCSPLGGVIVGAIVGYLFYVNEHRTNAGKAS